MRIGLRAGIWLMALLLPVMMWAQTVPTTTVQGTVYLAGGAPGSGTVLVSWPAFTTAANQQVAAGKTVVTVGSDGFLSVNLAANLGANPAGLYYTAVFHLSDGTVDTQYWVIPVAATATLASVQARLMPAAVAGESVDKADVDQAIAELAGSLLTANGGTLTGPLVLAGDPTTPLMAADKHYVDEVFAEAVPSGGGTVLGPLMAPAVNGVYSPEAGTGQTTLQATQTAAAAAGGSMVVPPTYAGTDTFSNTAGIQVEDLRASGAQQHERSVKEFGAVCDGVTNDTAALQAAINFAQAALASGHGIALTLPAGICKTHQLLWHLESIGGQGRQVSGLMGYPGEDVLATATDALNLPSNTRLHDFSIYVDQSADVSCSPAEGRAAAGSCGVNRPMEAGSVLVALRTRLVAANPARTILLRGAVRPGILVEEAEGPFAQLPADVFVLRWLGLAVDRDLASAMVAEECEVLYSTLGTQSFGGLDRGRTLSAMDEELVSILTPFWTPKLNYTAQPATAMLTNVFWDEPVFGPVTVVRDRLSRVARVVVYSYEEAGE